MISFQQISTSDIQLYKFMEELLTVAFPPEEYRELENLREYTDRVDNFHNNIIFDDETPVGFLTYWEFDSFYYIEHFAINPSLRNGGYGKRTLEHLLGIVKLPVVLEVEHPIEETAKRRISFYQRQGFRLWSNDYKQPPYRPGDTYLPMYLMVYGELSSEKDYQVIKEKLYDKVYGIHNIPNLHHF